MSWIPSIKSLVKLGNFGINYALDNRNEKKSGQSTQGHSFSHVTLRTAEMVSESVDKTTDKTVLLAHKAIDVHKSFLHGMGREASFIAGSVVMVGLSGFTTILMSRTCQDGIVCAIGEPTARLALLASTLFVSGHVMFNQFGHLIPSISLKIPDSYLRPDSTHSSFPLMQAAYQGELAVIQKLQKEGCNLAMKDSKGRTPLHWAAIGKQQQAIELLWYFGCDLIELDNDHRSPINYIRKGTPLYQIVSKLINTLSRFDFEKPIYLFYPPTSLVFQGGGGKGVAYLGALEYLVQSNLMHEVRRTVGTSAGAITALLVALGYNIQELRKNIVEKEFLSFLDCEYSEELSLVAKIASIPKDYRETAFEKIFETMLSTYQYFQSTEKRNPGTFLKTLITICRKEGVCEGEKLLNWINDLITDKTSEENCTFGKYRQLITSGRPFKHIHIYATKMDPAEIVCFSSENEEFDNVRIADAIRGSVSIPGVYVPHPISTIDGREIGVFLDGGMIKNFPIDSLDQVKYTSTNDCRKKIIINHQVLGFNLASPPIQSEKKPNVFSTVVSIYTEGETLLLKEHDRDRTISSDPGKLNLISSFLASPEEKEELIESAKVAFSEFFINQTQLALAHEEHNPYKLLSIFKDSKDSKPSFVPHIQKKIAQVVTKKKKAPAKTTTTTSARKRVVKPIAPKLVAAPPVELAGPADNPSPVNERPKSVSKIATMTREEAMEQYLRSQKS